MIAFEVLADTLKSPVRKLIIHGVIMTSILTSDNSWLLQIDKSSYLLCCVRNTHAV